MRLLMIGMCVKLSQTWPPRGIIKSAPSPVSKKKTVIIEEKPTHSSQVSDHKPMKFVEQS